tara:strand:+ start:1864 stop:2157 length:294 start_codon:yes stop_codon:yes gene_type:complete
MSKWIEGAALYAVGGDIVGMGATVEARFRPLDENVDPELVRAFLEMQTAEAVQYWTDNVRAMQTGARRYELGNQLIDAGVFKSKYDVRSTWILTEQV